MDIVSAKEALRIALEEAYKAENWAVVDHLSDAIVYLGWCSDFGMEGAEEEEA